MSPGASALVPGLDDNCASAAVNVSRVKAIPAIARLAILLGVDSICHFDDQITIRSMSRRGTFCRIKGTTAISGWKQDIIDNSEIVFICQKIHHSRRCRVASSVYTWLAVTRIQFRRKENLVDPRCNPDPNLIPGSDAVGRVEKTISGGCKIRLVMLYASFTTIRASYLSLEIESEVTLSLPWLEKDLPHHFLRLPAAWDAELSEEASHISSVSAGRGE